MAKETDIDKAFKLFYDKRYEKAIKAFDGILAKNKLSDSELARIKTFRNIADRQVTESDAPVLAGLGFIGYLMNEGRGEEAETLINDADLRPGVSEYLRAEIAVTRGELAEARTLLEKAIELDPANRGYAMNSPVIAAHRGEDVFDFLKNAES